MSQRRPQPRPRPRSGRRSALFLLARGLVAVLALYLILTRIDLREVAGAIAGARPLPVAAAFLLMLGVQALTAERLRGLARAQGIPLRTAQALEINLAAVFYGLFLPGGNVTGMAVRFLKIARVEGRLAGTAVAMTLDRLAATVSLGVVGLAFWLLDRPAGSGALAGVVASVSAVLLILTGLLLHGRAAAWLAAPLLRRGGRLGRLASVGTALEAARAMPLRLLAGLALLSVGAQLLGTLAFVLLAGSMSLAVPWTALAWIRSVVVFTTMVPLSISGLGLREGALLVLLAPFGVPGDAAVAFSLLFFATAIVAVGLVGGLLEGAAWLAGRGAPTGVRRARPDADPPTAPSRGSAASSRRPL